MDNFGIADLVEKLQERIQSDQALLTQVMSYWASSHSDQPLNDLDTLTPMSAVALVTGGKLTTGQVRWAAKNRYENGTAEAFVKIGKKLYCNVPLLVRLISTKQRGVK